MPGEVCMRQGYKCSCKACQIWISRWEGEINFFADFNRMMEDGKTLWVIHEHLRATNPELMQLHHVFLEAKYIENYTKEGEEDEDDKAKNQVKFN